MTQAYKKVLRTNKISKSYLIDTIFNGDNPSFVVLSFVKPNDETSMIDHRNISALEDVLWDKFEIYVNTQSNAQQSIIMCDDYIEMSPIRSKKSRVKQHAKLVRLEQIVKSDPMSILAEKEPDLFEIIVKNSLSTPIVTVPDKQSDSDSPF